MKLRVKRMLRDGLLLFGLLLAAQAVFAQRTVTGTITDAESGEGLIGAYVVAQGTSTGAVTDFDGNFSLTLPEGINALEVSYTGYGNQVIELTAGQTVVDIAMQSGEQLEEVVVIGYGTVKREDATGSV
ncbi:MAG: carboxypeptidase-like regulatory domain-containing protein, partial [Bacteroidota bacterium]